MKIYVACLASYNAGRLFGEWIDIEGLSSDQILTRIEQMLAKSPTPDAEEWSIHDYDEIPSRFGENPDLDALADYCDLVVQANDDSKIPAQVVEELYDGDVDHLRSLIEDSFSGVFESLADWAQETEENSCSEIPDHLANYINWGAMGRDAELGGDITTVRFNGDLYVFWNN